MNALALAQRFAREIGIAGVGPASITNQSGELGRVVNWLQAANVDIEAERQDWDFLRTSASFETVAGQGQYTPLECGIAAGDFGMWRKADDNFRCYLTATGYSSEIDLGVTTYDAWRATYNFGSNRTMESQPTTVAVAPNKSLCLGPIPAAGYTITGDYFAAPKEFADDTAEPRFPAAFHLIVVYRAMMHAGGFDAANEVYQRGEAEYKRLMNRLMRDQLTEVTIAGSLA